MGEYQILMGTEMASKLNEALLELMWFQNNPILNQPAQKWYSGRGIYRVLFPFGVFVTGDNILIDSGTHSRLVKLATAKEKQVFIPLSGGLNASMRFTPEEWFKHIRPVTKEELYKLLPHLSSRIKKLTGYFEYMKFYPEYLCTECFTKFNLELKKGFTKGCWKKRCSNCGKSNPVITVRNALKPIGK